METVFLFKEMDTEDGDCVKYIEIDRLGELKCGHYFSSINLIGACFSQGFEDNKNYSNCKTILTQDDFDKLVQYNKDIKELGYNIKQDSKRYNEGIKIYNKIESILKKLESKENQDLFNEIIKEEKELMMCENNLTEDDYNFIMDNYGLAYQDRGIVSYVWGSIEELSEELAESFGYVDNDNNSSKYFNYEQFGQDLLESEKYLELSDGRIATLSY